MTTQLIPRLLATHAVLVRPDQAALHASTSELWPMLAVVVDEPHLPGLFDALDDSVGVTVPSLRCTWSAALAPVPALRLTISGDAFHTEIVVPAQQLIDHLDLIATARTAALTTQDRAHHLAPGTSLRDAVRNVVLVGPAPTAELRRLARQQAPEDPQLRLAN